MWGYRLFLISADLGGFANVKVRRVRFFAGEQWRRKNLRCEEEALTRQAPLGHKKLNLKQIDYCNN